MLKVYGDESYDQERTIFAVGGVLGSDSEWAKVVEAWTTRTGARVFHASDCETHNGDFATKDDRVKKENHALYADLAKIIANSKLLCSGCVMDWSAFREFFPGIHDGAPYYKAFVHILAQCAEWAHLSVGERQIQVFFDQNHRTKATAELLYQQMACTPNWAYAGALAREPNQISFLTRKEPAIQVADLFARETMKYPESPIAGSLPRRLSLDALKRANRADIVCYTRSYFESWKEQWPELERMADLPMSRYAQWLNEQGQTDTPYQRFRYLIHVDEIERDRR